MDSSSKPIKTDNAANRNFCACGEQLPHFETINSGRKASVVRAPCGFWGSDSIKPPDDSGDDADSGDICLGQPVMVRRPVPSATGAASSSERVRPGEVGNARQFGFLLLTTSFRFVCLEVKYSDLQFCERPDPWSDLAPETLPLREACR